MLHALDRAKDLVIIGGGFIGVEFADECRKRGNLNVSIMEFLPHCLLLACDEEICSSSVRTKSRRKISSGSMARSLIPAL